MKNILIPVKKHGLTVLLFVYLSIFLIPHALHELSWIMLMGLVVAVWSHTKKGWLSPALLLLHITLEWTEWLHSPAFWGWLPRLAHAWADVAVYRHEISAHKRAQTWLWGGATFLLIFVSSSFLFEIPEEILELLHQFSLGGAVGCVGSHLWFHIFKEHKALP